jgi:RNA polymerase sigma-70 factor (ECF subfamily)
MGADAILDERSRLRLAARPAVGLPSRADVWLVRRAKDGSPDAVDALVRQHWPKVYRAALLIVQDSFAAEDIAQEALLAAVRSLDRFDWRRPISPWLHRIVVNQSVDYLRQMRRQVNVDREHRAVDTDLQVEFAHDAESRNVAAALNQLDPVDRAIVVMRHLLEYRSSEIGGMLEMPPATVRTRLRRAMTQLRDELEMETDYERKG